MQTTFLKKKEAMSSGDIERCHDGRGAIGWVGVLDGDDPGGESVNFVHDDVLPPNTSIGVHEHTGDQEYYYILSGCGVMTLDGEEHPVGPGDVAVVFPGGTHGLENRSEEELRIIVFSVSV
jgi:uncharacterized cupin superfamily protein